jgi:hypothetical protein
MTHANRAYKCQRPVVKTTLDKYVCYCLRSMYIQCQKCVVLWLEDEGGCPTNGPNFCRAIVAVNSFQAPVSIFECEIGRLKASRVEHALEARSLHTPAHTSRKLAVFILAAQLMLCSSVCASPD